MSKVIKFPGTHSPPHNPASSNSDLKLALYVQKVWFELTELAPGADLETSGLVIVNLQTIVTMFRHGKRPKQCAVVIRAITEGKEHHEETHSNV